MSKKEHKEEQAVAPQDFISTTHKTEYRARFKGAEYKLETPLVSLEQIIDFLNFFLAEANKTLMDAKAGKEELGECEPEGTLMDCDEILE